jgi:S1-C subfamily serine protease
LANAETKEKQQAGSRVQGRRVSIGTVPDFAFQGAGVLISDIVKDSPAAQAGLQKGDVISRINGIAVPDLAAYAKILRAMSPGDSAELNYLRGGKAYIIKLVVVER